MNDEDDDNTSRFGEMALRDPGNESSWGGSQNDSDHQRHEEGQPEPSRYQQAVHRVQQQQQQQQNDLSGQQMMARGNLLQQQSDDMPQAMDDEDEIKGLWEFEPDIEDAEIDAAETERGDDPDWCYFCEYVQTDRQKELNPHYKRYIALIVNNYEHMPRATVAEKGIAVYTDYFRKEEDYLKDKVMRRLTLLRHFEHHAIFQRVRIVRQLRELDRCVAVIASQLREKDKTTQQRRLHEKNLKLYLSLTAKQSELIVQLDKLKKQDGDGDKSTQARG